MFAACENFITKPGTSLAGMFRPCWEQLQHPDEVVIMAHNGSFLSVTLDLAEMMSSSILFSLFLRDGYSSAHHVVSQSFISPARGSSG